jgi:hypothetical protein
VYTIQFESFNDSINECGRNHVLSVLVAVYDILQSLRLRPGNKYVKQGRVQGSFDQDRASNQETGVVSLVGDFKFVIGGTDDNTFDVWVCLPCTHTMKSCEDHQELLLLVFSRLLRYHVLILESTKGGRANVLFWRERLPNEVTSLVLNA